MDERYRNRFTGKVVTVKAIESVRVGPGDKHVDVMVLKDGSRWQAGEASWPRPQFHACHQRRTQMRFRQLLNLVGYLISSPQPL